MIIFWLMIALMTLVAMSFLVVSLFKQYTKSLPSKNTSQSYGLIEEALDTRPIFNSRHPKEFISNATKHGYAVILILLLCLPLLAISLYLKLGASEQITEQQQAAQKDMLIDAEIKKLGSLQNIILTLKQKITENPDAKGWALLARLYLKNQQFKEASDAFAQANQLAPHQVEILVGYAESLYFWHKLVLTTQAKQLLVEALQIQPNQPDALNLLGMDAYQRGSYATAISYWEKLLSQLQQGSEAQQKLLQMIAKAQEKAN